MSSEETGKKSMVIALDGGKLGHIAGAIVALTVMILSMYLSNTDALTTFKRAGWAFVVGYGATFFLVRVILRITLRQLLEDRRVELEEKRTRHREARTRERGDKSEKGEGAEVQQEESPEA